MFRLILKDFYLLRRTLPFIGIWLAFVTISNVTSKSEPDPVLAFIPIFLSFILIGNAIALDEKYKLEYLYCSLPLKRTTIVYAKYLSTLLIILAGIILSFLAGLLFPKQLLTPGVSFFVLFFFSLFFSVILPFSYKFGIQLEGDPGKLALVFLFIVSAIAVVTFIIVYFNINIFKIKIIYLSLFLAAFVFVSVKLSVVFYNKRDF